MAAPFIALLYRAELGLVVGRKAKDLPADERALECLAGYTCGIDVSARGMGRMGPSRMGKSFDTFTPIGPAIARRYRARRTVAAIRPPM